MPIVDMLPEEQQKSAYFAEFLARELQVAKEDILDFELGTYCIEEPAYIGIEETMLSAPRLDNQTSVAALLEAIMSADRKNGINLIALFDHEEIGNTSKQGAASILLHDMARRIARGLGLNEEQTDCMLYDAFVGGCSTCDASESQEQDGHHESAGDGQRILYQGSLLTVLCNRC